MRPRSESRDFEEAASSRFEEGIESRSGTRFRPTRSYTNPKRSSVMVIEACPHEHLQRLRVDACGDHEAGVGVAAFVQRDGAKRGFLPHPTGPVGDGP
jgi:hypothetical protein